MRQVDITVVVGLTRGDHMTQGLLYLCDLFSGVCVCCSYWYFTFREAVSAGTRISPPGLTKSFVKLVTLFVSADNSASFLVDCLFTSSALTLRSYSKLVMCISMYSCACSKFGSLLDCSTRQE